MRKLIALVMFAGCVLSVSSNASAEEYRYWYAPVGIPCRAFPYDPSVSGDATRAKEDCERITDKTCTTYSAPKSAPGYIC